MILVAQEHIVAEQTLHYIWMKGINIPAVLETVKGEKIEIISRGNFNRYQDGPDFLNAKVKYNGVLFHGNIEIHVNSEEWYLHNHHKNPKYNSCILHVVLNSNGQTILREDGTEIPEVSLTNYFNSKTFYKINKFLNSSFFNKKPCERWQEKIPEKLKREFIYKALKNRLYEKADFILKRLVKNHYDWAQALWEVLLYYAGSPTNKENFMRLAEYVKYGLIAKYINIPEKIYALILGVIGELENKTHTNDTEKNILLYWELLKNKHNLKQIKLLPLTRSGRVQNFPEYKLIQVATLLANVGDIFEIMQLPYDYVLQLPEYWQAHYSFKKKIKKPIRKIRSLSKVIYLNVSIPYLLAKAIYNNDDYDLREIIDQYKVPKETNRIVSAMEKSFKYESKNAGESQGLIHIHKTLCSLQRCAVCPIADYILNN